MSEKLLKYFNTIDPEDFIPNVWVSKYRNKNEEIPEEMHLRMARELSRVTQKSVDYWMHYLRDFSKIIPQGSIMASLGTDTVASLSNCFVIGQPKDSYSGIFYKDQQMGQLMKRRGGVGLDISTLRPKSTIVNNAAKSSTGTVSFMHRYSNTTREVAQDGRRGALMLTIDCRHPDVLDFINSKQDRSQITGANISVMLRDDFMEAVKNDGDYILRFPCETELSDTFASSDKVEYNVLKSCMNSTIPGDKIYWKKVKAKEIYNAIVENAWDNAEPGQMFIDRHWDYSPDSVYPMYKGITTNPCGEIFMQPFDACRLLCLNLLSIIDNPYTSSAKINYSRLLEYSSVMMEMADAIVDLEIEYIERIISKILSDPEPYEEKLIELDLWKKIKKVAASSRRTGNGITGLGDLFAAINIPYDSKEALVVAHEVMKTKMRGELQTSINLSKLKGPFTGYDFSLEFGYDSTNKLVGKNKFFQMLVDEFPDLVTKMMLHGRRNISWSTVAPTGTVSILGKSVKYHNISAGGEPQFSLGFIRKKKINPNDENARVDSTDQNGDNWQHFPILMGSFKDWIEINFPALDINSLSPEDIKELEIASPWNGSLASDIDWKKRVELQSVIQKFTSHSISSTINLPSTATKELVEDIYMYSYEKGLKGVTIYREGSRTGVLVKEDTPKEEFKYRDAVKRPKVLECDIYKTKCKGSEFLVVVGILNNKPYEVFCIENQFKIQGTTFHGTITKEKRGHYSLNIEDIMTIDKFTVAMSDEEQAITRLISTSLRHGTDIKFIVEQLNKTNGDLQSFGKAIARILKKYIPNESAATGISCNNCKSENIKYQEGCMQCLDCGNSKC